MSSVFLHKSTPTGKYLWTYHMTNVHSLPSRVFSVSKSHSHIEKFSQSSLIWCAALNRKLCTPQLLFMAKGLWLTLEMREWLTRRNNFRSKHGCHTHFCLTSLQCSRFYNIIQKVQKVTQTSHGKHCCRTHFCLALYIVQLVPRCAL